MTQNTDDRIMEAPELTLTPDIFGAEAAAVPAETRGEELLAQTEAAAPEAPQVTLTPEEQKMVDDFAQKIDLANSGMILQYGAEEDCRFLGDGAGEYPNEGSR